MESIKKIAKDIIKSSKYEAQLVNETFYERVLILSIWMAVGAGFTTVNKTKFQPRNMVDQIPVLQSLPQPVKDFYQGSLGDFAQSGGSASIASTAINLMPIPSAIKPVIANIGSVIPATVGTWRDTNFTVPRSELKDKMFPNTEDVSKIDLQDPIKDKSDVTGYWAGLLAQILIDGGLRERAKKLLEKKNSSGSEK